MAANTREETSMASDVVSRPSVGGPAKRRRRTMDGNFTIGRFGGVEVRLHWSLLAVFALIVWSLADGVFPSQNPGLSDGTYLAMAIVAAFLFVASIVLHEALPAAARSGGRRPGRARALLPPTPLAIAAGGARSSRSW